MTKQQTVKQHFVPQFYLRRFADDDGFLHIFNLKKKQIEPPKTPKHVCYEPYYYAIKTGEPDEVSQEIEVLLGDIENQLAPEIARIEKEILGTRAISPGDKFVVATLCSMLWLRGGYMRRQISNMNEELTKQQMKFMSASPEFDKKMEEFYREEGKEYTDEERRKMHEFIVEERYSVQIGNNQHIMMIFEGLEGFRNLFFGKSWRIYISASPKHFMTSDNPVSEWIPKRISFLGASFLERKHYFPLAPTIMIEMTHPTNSEKNIRRKTLYSGSDEIVDVLNILTANYSHGFIFTDSDKRPVELDAQARSGGSVMQAYFKEFDN